MKVLNLNSLTAVLLALTLAAVPMTTGCTGSQIAGDIANVESKLPQLAQLATGLAVAIDPEYAPVIAPIAGRIKTIGDDLVTLITAYQAAPNATLLGKVNAAVQDGVANVNALASLSGIKSTRTLGLVQAAAGLMGLIFNDIADFASKNGPPAVISQLPAAFGWHIAGVDLVAIDGKALPPPKPGATKPSGYNARAIAKHWNALCKDKSQAQIPVPRMHVLGVGVPFTGKK